jgi:hypothetical protein
MGTGTMSVSAHGTMRASVVPVMVPVRAVRVAVARPAVAAASDRRGNVVGGTSRHTTIAAIVLGYCKGVVHGIWGGRHRRRICIWRRIGHRVCAAARERRRTGRDVVWHRHGEGIKG